MGSKVLTTALKKVAAAGQLRSKLSSEEIGDIRASIRRRAIFSAKVTNARIIESMRDVTTRVLKGDLSPQSAREVLRHTVERTRYKAPPGKEGTIQDLTSNARLDLIVRTNVDMARGYGLLVDAQRDLVAFPFWQLYRKFIRLEPRDWPARWRAAGKTLRGGKMVAPVNDPVWTRISRFGNPYPPFDYNSGMSVRRMSLKRGLELGLREPKEQRKKRLPSIGVDEANVVGDPKLAKQLLKDLGPGYYIERGVVRGAAE